MQSERHEDPTDGPFVRLSKRFSSSMVGLQNKQVTRESLAELCTQMIIRSEPGESVTLVLPTEEPKQIKKNKVRLIFQDRTSPMGIVIKDDSTSDILCTSGTARFSAYDLLAWAYRQPE